MQEGELLQNNKNLLYEVGFVYFAMALFLYFFLRMERSSLIRINKRKKSKIDKCLSYFLGGKSELILSTPLPPFLGEKWMKRIFTSIVPNHIPLDKPQKARWCFKEAEKSKIIFKRKRWKDKMMLKRKP